MTEKPNSKPIILLICFYLILLILMTFIYSICMEWRDILPHGLTFRYYIEIFTDMEFLIAIVRTIIISVVPVVICTVTVLLAMYVILLYLPGLDKYMQILTMIPYSIQGVILSIGVLSLYANAPMPLSNRFVMLTGTYCIIILPYIYRGIKNCMTTINAKNLIESAQILGASKAYAFISIIIPNILSGIKVSLMLSMAIIFGDFVVVNIIGGNYYQTVQIYLYRALFRSGQLSSAIIVVLFLITMALSAGVYAYKKPHHDQEEI
ncbi:ABC transporter permease [Acetobacterium sp. K1/6]|uniref:ABC transporter permease n=1 Tax=Acetobacterium sp. K1/6 TaxID=3055467 RepID=UPI002ACA2077|nr:ABC transporter permease subunit [Acetobacterium sp. K1/6]MDZ5726095.1 ABC transporter permease subunit [Acetobacterium sp. K1/6]